MRLPALSIVPTYRTIYIIGVFNHSLSILLPPYSHTVLTQKRLKQFCEMLPEMLGRKRSKKGRIRMELLGSSAYECVRMRTNAYECVRMRTNAYEAKFYTDISQ